MSPTSGTIESEVRALVLDETGLPPETAITDDTLLKDDLGLESLARLSLATALERRFGIEITDAAFDNIKSFGDVCDLVQAHGECV